MAGPRGLQQPVVGGKGDCLGDVGHVEFLEELAAVELHRVERAADVVANLLHGVALRRKGEHLFLLGGERDTLAGLPAVGGERILAVSALSQDAETNLSGLLVRRERDGAEGEPGTPVSREHEGRNLVVDEQGMLRSEDVEVVGHRAASAVGKRHVVEGTEARTVQFGEHRLLVGRHVVDVEAVAHLSHLVGGVPAEEERVVGHIEEVLAEVVDDVDALVGRLRESLRRLHVRLCPLVVGLGDALHAVRVKEEFVYLCHNCLVLILGCKFKHFSAKCLQ